MAMRILIVDDSSMARKLVRRTLDMAGFPIESVRMAENGVEALAVLDKERVDLVLLDLNMPKMGGIETLERMRASDGTKRTPVIVVSTEGAESRIQKVKEHGAGFLRKPFATEDLVDAVIGALAS